MSNEAGPDQPKDQPHETATDLSTPNQDLLLAAQEHVHNAAPRARSSETDITVEGLGKLIGRDRTPVLSADVFKLAAIGMKDIEIAEWHGVDANTLRYHFSVQLLKGRLTLNQSLRRKQIEVAMGGNPTMLIFLGKNLLGQSDSPLSTTEKLPLPWDDNQ
jgi:hypothetical protein